MIDAIDGHLMLERLLNLKSLTLENVKINGARQISVFDNTNYSKKVYAKNLTFTNVPDEICNTAEDSNELNCSKNPDFNNNAEKVAFTSLVLIPLFLFGMLH